MKFSKQTGNFYPDDIQYSEMPDDVIKVTGSDYQLAMNRTSGETLDLLNGRIVVVPAASPTPEEQQAVLQGEMTNVVQTFMDQMARLSGYDSIATAVTYAEEPSVPQFQSEGQAFRAWRSLVWAKCNAVLADVLGGKRDVPTTDELIAELPALKGI